jgi:UMF1 family MFS transporter
MCVLERLGLHRPELRAWALYDWANSAMVTTIVAAVFPIYFYRVAGANLSEGVATQRFAVATTVSLLLVALLAPVLGAIADYAAVKKRMLGTFLALGVAAVAGMYFIHQGDWILALVLFMLADIGASGSFIFYDALLPHVAREDEVDRVSTTGYALGYLGGGLLLALNFAWIQWPAWFGLPEGDDLTEGQATLPARLAFLSVAVWWLVFSIPLFLRVREPAGTLEAGERLGQNPVRVAFHRLHHVFGELRGYKQAFLMLLAFLIYNDGIGTIIKMAAIYGTEIGIDQGSLLASLLLVQFVGIPFALLFGAVAGKLGPKLCIFLALLVYVGITALGYFMTSAVHFFVLAILVGMVQGGAQALSRSLFASMIPKHRSAEFFSFFALSEKFAGILGPALFAVTITLTGSSRYGIISVLLFFVVGGLLLGRVDVEAGQRAAHQALEMGGTP